MRRRILLAIVSVTAVAVILFAVPLAFTLSNLYREQEVNRLARAAAEVSEHIPATVQVGDSVDLAQHPARKVALYAPDGRRVAGVGPPRGGESIRAALRGDVRDAAGRQ